MSMCNMCAMSACQTSLCASPKCARLECVVSLECEWDLECVRLLSVCDSHLLCATGICQTLTECVPLASIRHSLTHMTLCLACASHAHQLLRLQGAMSLLKVCDWSV